VLGETESPQPATQYGQGKKKTTTYNIKIPAEMLLGIAKRLKPLHYGNTQ